jgi:hypothetical protein
VRLCLRIGPLAASYEHSSEPYGYIKGAEFHDKLRSYELIRSTLIHVLEVPIMYAENV